MITRNVELVKINQSVFDIRIISTELEDLYKKHDGWCNVKISRPESKGTEEQNRAMHSLLTEYYKTGFSSSPEGCTLAEFKVFMKLQFGPVYDFHVDCKNIKVPKSWADYSKQERHDFIDGLISEIHQSGAYNHSDKIRQIIEGMELNK
jgi:hypothetical protein